MQKKNATYWSFRFTVGNKRTKIYHVLQISEYDVRSYEPSVLRLSNHPKRRALLLASVCKSFVRLGYHSRWTAWPQWEISVKCFSQDHNDALPVWESKQGSATSRSLTDDLQLSYRNAWVLALFLNILFLTLLVLMHRGVESIAVGWMGIVGVAR